MIIKTQSAIDLCKQALSIDSSMGNGTTEYTQFILKIADELGLKIKTKNYLFRDIDFQNMLLYSSKTSAEIKYLFVNPLDTESPGPFRAWTETGQDPFDITIKNKKMYGLGANSGKLNTILLLKALSQIEESKRKSIGFLGTYGREVRSHGALKFLRELKVNPKNIINGFPTDNKIVTSQPGRFRMRINFPFTDIEKALRANHDEQEHSSSESQYFHSNLKTAKLLNRNIEFWKTNAIGEALSFLENLPDQLLILDFAGGKDLYSDPRSCLLEFDMGNRSEVMMGLRLKNFYRLLRELSAEFVEHKNLNYKPEVPMIHLGRVVCDLEGIEFWGECVFSPGISEEISTPWILKLRDEISNLGGASKMLSQRWPYVYKGNEVFMNELCKISGSQESSSSSYTSEADLFKLAGYESIIYGPGDFSKMFLPNESIETESLEASLDFYSKTLNYLSNLQSL